MPLNKLENFIKNYEGRILYVNSNDLDATDSITNQGNSLTKPFKTIQRALIEAARFSFVVGNDNDYNSRTTILVYPGDHIIDNRPGYGIRKAGTALAEAISPGGDVTSPASDELTLTLESNFDLTQEDNILYKFNSVHGGVVLPRGTSLVGMDLRKTKIRPKYVPNPTDGDVPDSALFRITCQCYFWQFSIFDGDDSETVYTDNKSFTAGSGNLATPTFSHHKLTCFEYADGVNNVVGYDTTDLDMYYAKLSNAFNEGSGRQIPAAQKFPLAPEAFAKERPEWEIVGAFATDPVNISSIISGDSATPSPIISVTTETDHGLTVGTPIKIRGVNVNDYNVSTVVTSVSGKKQFTYLLPYVRNNLPASPGGSATVTIETDSVKGSSPYIFNCSLRSVWGMNGMRADGTQSSGFRSMVVAQFTGISLQKDDRAFVKYDPVTRTYTGLPITKVTGAQLASESAATDSNRVYHLDQEAVYRTGWETSHIKIIKDSILQIVSVFAIGFNKHFETQSGGDASVTNSNSNFGQFALAAEGFKKESFSKDNHGYITSVISPKFVPLTEINYDWISIDVAKTVNTGISSHLYLYGFDTKDNVPPNLIQGYRVGARTGDELYLDIASVGTKSVAIHMADNMLGVGVTAIEGTTSGVKEYVVGTPATAPDYDRLTFTSNHSLQTGEPIVIISDDGDLPENITANKKYYAVTTNQVHQIKVASSPTNAKNGTGLKIYGGTNLRVLSRISDRDSGDMGSPIQYDPIVNNWFVHTSAANDIYDQIVSTGIAGFGEPRTDVAYFKRISDDRSIDDKIYKVRVVIPKEAINAKDPQEGFVLQESSSTGSLTNSEFSLSAITSDDYSFKRNPKFISTCTYDSTNKIITVTTEQPHNLQQGERILIKNVKSSQNLTGFGVTGFNGDFNVLTVSDSNTFTYGTTDVDGLVHTVGIFSGSNSLLRDISLPRVERNDLNSNLYVYRRETISPYEYNVQDGIYHLYVLNSSNAIPTEFTNYNYEQNVVDLYPQLDRDNVNDNPPSASSFARRSPIGDVVTSDLKKSITRESVDIAVKKFGTAPVITNVSATSAGVTTVTTSLEHGLGGIIGYSAIVGNAQAYPAGTFYNVKLLNADDSWNGASAKVVVSGAGNSITSLEVTAKGSGYQTGATLKVEGFNNATIGINSSVISSSKNNSVQITGLGTATDGLFRIVDVPTKTSVAIARTTGDPEIYSNHFLFNVAPTATISSRVFNSTLGITTFTCGTAHGLVQGNKFRILDDSDNNLGDYVVNDIVGINTFVAKTTIDLDSTPSGNRVLKHGFGANNLTSDVDGENLGARGISFFDNEYALLKEDILTDVTTGIATFSIQPYDGAGSVGVGTTTRFPLGSFIQIGNEILRISSSTLTGSGNNQIQAIRGYLGTRKEDHQENSVIKKIKPIPIEFRRPSLIRSSGQTFEYLGYGPGNYSTGLPQIQNKTLTERENFLAQSQERGGGQVVYTGMNSDGDFFIGNTKYSAASGTQQTFDIPVSTVTGQDPSRLSAVFDEIIVKERILVEGGKSKQILSQFDGPVTFNENLIVNDETKLNGPVIISNIVRHTNTTNSTSPTTGAAVFNGGIGVAQDIQVGGNVSIAGTTVFDGEVVFNTGLVADATEDSYLGRATREWSGAWVGGIGIATEGVPGGTEVADRTIEGLTGNLVLKSKSGVTSITDRLEVGYGLSVSSRGGSYLSGITTVGGNLMFTDTGKLIFGDGSDMEVFHNGNDSFLRFNDVGVGGFFVLASEFRLRDSSNNEDYIRCTRDQEVSLFYNGMNRFETIGYGVSCHGWFSVGVGTDPGNYTNIGIVPGEDLGATVGVSTLRWKEAWIGNLRLAEGANDNEIDTSTGNLEIDTAGGTVTVDDNLTVSGVLDCNTRAEIDNVRIDGQKIDTTSGKLELDSATNEVEINAALDLNGTLDVSSTSTFGGDLDINANVDMDGNLDLDGQADIDNININGNTIHSTTGGNLVLFATGADVRVADNLSVELNATIDDNLTVVGNTELNGSSTKIGNATSDALAIEGTATFNHNALFNKDVTLGNGTGDNIKIEGAADFNHTLTCDNTVTFTSGTQATNTTSGALQVSGGVGIAKNLHVGGTITGTLSGNSGSATQIKVQTENNNAWRHLTFTSSTSGNADLKVDNDSGITFNPSSNELKLKGDIIAFATSDLRLKDNVKPIEGALSKLLGISGNTFTWNDASNKEGEEDTGVIAQEIDALGLPGTTTIRDDGTYAVRYEKLVPLLIEAVKELSAKVDNLEQQLSDK